MLITVNEEKLCVCVMYLVSTYCVLYMGDNVYVCVTESDQYLVYVRAVIVKKCL